MSTRRCFHERLAGVSADPRNPDLEAALAENPDDDEAYRAYARWLTERGDSQGELISLALDHEQKQATVRAYDQATQRIDAAGFFRPSWRRGFIERAVCLSEYEAMNPEQWRHYPSSEDVVQFLQRREARLLRDLDLVDTQALSPCALLLALPAAPPLRRLVITTGDAADRMSALWARFPRLRSLSVRCAALGDLALPELEELTLRIPVTEAPSLSRARAPKLRELSAHFDFAAGSGPDALASPLPECPALRKFTLSHDGDAPPFLDALLRSPLLPRLHELDLSLARFPEHGDEVIRAVESGHLDHLRRLDLGGALTAKALPPEAVRRLRDRMKERLGVF